MELEGKVSKEDLYHFQCGDKKCQKYWAIGDAPARKIFGIALGVEEKMNMI